MNPTTGTMYKQEHKAETRTVSLPKYLWQELIAKAIQSSADTGIRETVSGLVRKAVLAYLEDGND